MDWHFIFKHSIKCNICRLRENRHQFISFPPECKARNIQTLVSIIKEHHALLICQTITKDERCCSSWGGRLMLDWFLQWVPQIQQGFQIKWYGMIFITRLAYLAVLMGKELGSSYSECHSYRCNYLLQYAITLLLRLNKALHHLFKAGLPFCMTRLLCDIKGMNIISKARS